MAEIIEQSLEQIWSGDLFKRQEEAKQLIAYIESAVTHRPKRDDKRALTVAVEARYGEGKTFFLRRLSQHIALNHPVAFVDAWADDLADQPLTALASTLNDALRPFMESPEVRKRVGSFMEKTGKVAKIAGVGLFKKAASLAISSAGVDAIGEVLSEASDEMKDAAKDAVKEVASGVVDEMETGVKQPTPKAFMEERVANFEAGRRAVQEMKESLAGIVSSLSAESRKPPIIILIDELDRCRPTYAVKLLEEIKHLFDVPGIVFILGLHSEQLSHSVAGAYGAGFNGRSYLRRFIDREYRLAEPDLVPLLERLCQQAGLSDALFTWPPVAKRDKPGQALPLPNLLAIYMRMFDLKARDAFSLVDRLQTSAALVEGKRLHLAYLVPLAVGQMLGLPSGATPEVPNDHGWVFEVSVDHLRRDRREYAFEVLAQHFREASSMTEGQLAEGMNNRPSYPVAAVNDARVWNAIPQPLWAVESYPRLIASVGRFTSPAIEVAAARTNAV